MELNMGKSNSSKLAHISGEPKEIYIEQSTNNDFVYRSADTVKSLRNDEGASVLHFSYL